jgi:hypothetical protein
MNYPKPLLFNLISTVLYTGTLLHVIIKIKFTLYYEPDRIVDLAIGEERKQSYFSIEHNPGSDLTLHTYRAHPSIPTYTANKKPSKPTD